MTHGWKKKSQGNLENNLSWLKMETQHIKIYGM